MCLQLIHNATDNYCTYCAIIASTRGAVTCLSEGYRVTHAATINTRFGTCVDDQNGKKDNKTIHIASLHNYKPW